MQICFKHILSLISFKNKGLPREAKRSGGFTLVELIVVMAIAIVMITSLVIQQSSWNDSLSVSTQAYEMALMIRQAQIYSLGVKEDTAGGGDKFNIGYGIHFDTNPARYIYFADRNGNQKYDSGEETETKTFTRGVTVEDVCGSSECIYTGGGPLKKAGILFFRPEAKAIISLLNNGGNSVDSPPVTVTLKSVGGKEYKVIVQTNGQVSITQ